MEKLTPEEIYRFHAQKENFSYFSEHQILADELVEALESSFSLPTYIAELQEELRIAEGRLVDESNATFVRKWLRKGDK